MSNIEMREYPITFIPYKLNFKKMYISMYTFIVYDKLIAN